MGDVAAHRVFGTQESIHEEKKGCYLSESRVMEIETTYTDSKRGEGALRAPSPLMGGSIAALLGDGWQL